VITPTRTNMGRTWRGSPRSSALYRGQGGCTNLRPIQAPLAQYYFPLLGAPVPDCTIHHHHCGTNLAGQAAQLCAQPWRSHSEEVCEPLVPCTVPSGQPANSPWGTQCVSELRDVWDHI
jgi:hypothetical protein